MTKRSAIYKPGDVIVIPFPYTDNIERSKRRPALVISVAGFNSETGQLICAMITSGKSSKWPHDTRISDLTSAGLKFLCVVRMKLFTIDQRFVLRKAGTLGRKDSVALAKALKSAIKV